MDCDKRNIASAKSIINNGGELVKEVEIDNEMNQFYWISLKKRFVTTPGEMECVESGSVKITKIEDEDFKGDLAFIKFDKMHKPYVVKNNGFCMANDGYKWLEFYDYDKKYRLCAMYDENNEIAEWYFDIAKKIGKDNGVPYEDDLYLDVVVSKEGEVKLLDEDELKAALDRLEISQEDYDMAYNEAHELMKKIENDKEGLKRFTDKYLQMMIK